MGTSKVGRASKLDDGVVAAKIRQSAGCLPTFHLTLALRTESRGA